MESDNKMTRRALLCHAATTATAGAALLPLMEEARATAAPMRRDIRSRGAVTLTQFDVTVDSSRTLRPEGDLFLPDSRSLLELGVTHTKWGIDCIEEAKLTSEQHRNLGLGKQWLSQACTYQAFSLMAWGSRDPQPRPPTQTGGVDWYEWNRQLGAAAHDLAGLRDRARFIATMPGAIPVLTLCTVPDWMKGSPAKPWDPEVAPLRQHFPDFARLAAAAAEVCYLEGGVRHFTIWNEMKGLWDSSKNTWNYGLYQEMYTQLRAALKAKAAQLGTTFYVGGPYLTIEGTGSGYPANRQPGDEPLIPNKKYDWYTDHPLRGRQRTGLQQCIDKWKRDNEVPDYFVVDRGLIDFADQNSWVDNGAKAYTDPERMLLTRWFGEITRQLRQLLIDSGLPTVPLWFAEYYGTPKGMAGQTKAALHASILYHMMVNGASNTLLWQPMDMGEVGHALFSDIRQANLQTFPLFQVYSLLRQYFPKGTQLKFTEVRAAGAPPGAVPTTLREQFYGPGNLLEVVGSDQCVQFINKQAVSVSVRVNGARMLTLAPYEVRWIDPISGVTLARIP